MAKIRNELLDVKAVVKRKIETTYEYVPIIGEVLGYWRKDDQMMAGETIELHIKTHLEAYDRLVINGEQIEIPKKEK
jgi:hypothetical protein